MANKTPTLLSRLDSIAIAKSTTLNNASLDIRKLFLSPFLIKILAEENKKVFMQCIEIFKLIKKDMSDNRNYFFTSFYRVCGSIPDKNLEEDTIKIINAVLIYMCFGNMAFEKYLNSTILETAEKKNFEYQRKKLEFNI